MLKHQEKCDAYAASKAEAAAKENEVNKNNVNEEKVTATNEVSESDEEDSGIDIRFPRGACIPHFLLGANTVLDLVEQLLLPEETAEMRSAYFRSMRMYFRQMKEAYFEKLAEEKAEFEQQSRARQEK